MENLLNWYNNESTDLHPLERAAIFHVEFIRIHPFADGNGRTGRLLVNYELVKNGYPTITIKATQRGEYLEAINEAVMTGNATKMVDLLALQKQFILAHLGAGDVAVDFTMGNGHDTLFFSQTVGESGHVYAFDIQPDALISTKKRLVENGACENYTLICDSHHNAKKYIDGKIKAGMFNLGYLPGGDKSKHTMYETTLTAVKHGIELLKGGGVLVISVYPGHEEGRREGEMLLEYLSTYDRKYYSVMNCRMINSSDSPFIIAVEKYAK